MHTFKKGSHTYNFLHYNAKGDCVYYSHINNSQDIRKMSKRDYDLYLINCWKPIMAEHQNRVAQEHRQEIKNKHSQLITPKKNLLKSTNIVNI